MSNTCENKTTCYLCHTDYCDDGCPIDLDSCCVFYNGVPLDNINVETGDTLCEILSKLNTVNLAETVFSANTTDSIIGVPNGIYGHSPFYHVKINPDNRQAITVGNQGLFVDKTQFEHGKVKVDSNDALDYLENQLFPGTDTNDIFTVTPLSVGGKIYLIPSVDKDALLAWLQTGICNIVRQCTPLEPTTSTTSTSTTSTTSTSSSSSSSTTAPTYSNYYVNNETSYNINVDFTDSVSLLNYNSNTYSPSTVSSTTYLGSNNLSKLTIYNPLNISVSITVYVNGSSFYTGNVYLGTVTIGGIPANANVEVTLEEWEGTTTSSTTSTTSTSTTTLPAICVTYRLINTNVTSKKVFYTSCGLSPVNVIIPPSTSVEVCTIRGTVTPVIGVTITELSEGCNTTTTSTTSTTSTSTTSTSSTSTTSTSSTTTTIPPIIDDILITVTDENSFSAYLDSVSGFLGLSPTLLSIAPGGSYAGQYAANSPVTISVIITGATSNSTDSVSLFKNNFGTPVETIQLGTYGSGSHTYTFSALSLTTGDQLKISVNSTA